jgi:hypothetical protein
MVPLPGNGGCTPGNNCSTRGYNSSHSWVKMKKMVLFPDKNSGTSRAVEVPRPNLDRVHIPVKITIIAPHEIIRWFHSRIKNIPLPGKNDFTRD